MALNNVPLTGQSLAVTKVPINANFSTIDNAFAVDHVRMTPPGTAAPQGFHNKITLPVQSVSPGPGFAANNGIYALNSALTGITETFWHSQSSNGPFDFPVTANIYSTTPVPNTINTLSGQGWCYLPSGLLMKWGTATALAPTVSGSVVFPVAANIPAFTSAVFTLQLTMGNTGITTAASINYFNVSNLGFSWFVSNNNGNSRFTYLAIGF